MLYADIIVDISHEKLDRIFQYRIPEMYINQAIPGKIAIIPFGQGNRQIKGYIVNVTNEASYDVSKIKDIIGIDDTQVGFDSKIINLAYQIKERYGGTIIDSLKTVIPVKKKVKPNKKRFIRLAISKEQYNVELSKYVNSKKFQARYRLLLEFGNADILEETLVVDKLNISKSVINSLENAGIISIEECIEYRDPVKFDTDFVNKKILNEEQAKIVEEIITDIDAKVVKNYLIHGVTGSGKTEVYMEIIEHVINKGKKVIVLIPEIALTYQTVKRFCERFHNRVSIMNSRLSFGERYDQYLRAKAGEVDIVIGPRSALFTPFENLGLIVIDEEHEGSYKSEMPPKYDARQVALMLAKISECSVILGSATPSIESYYKAMKGEYELKKLENRANNASFPKVYVEDLRQEMKNGNKSIFSKKLDELIKDRLAKHEQVMLFINRRGYSGFVSCRSCGHIIKCPHCDVSLTYHSHNDMNNNVYGQAGKLVCHYCGYETATISSCPECSSRFISIFGTGTQKVEMMAKKMYPGARILRMDADTTRTKNGHADILAAFSNHEADILIGTQMIVKGHDFPKVTLVGVLAADLSLGSNDYNAAENTFQILLQAAGRAGRGEKAGEVVIQTYRTEHYSVSLAANRDYENFYKQDMLARKLMSYPPVINMLSILIMCKNEEKAEELANVLAQMCGKNSTKNIGNSDNKNEINILGPTNAVITRLNDLYRKVIYIKCPDEIKLAKLRNKMQIFVRDEIKYKDCVIHFDMNPAHSV